MKRRTRGFTLIEVLITILIGAILTSIAVKGFGLTSSEMSVRQAKNVFTGMVARARAMAIERGTLTMFYVDTNADSISISYYLGESPWWDLEETVHFGDEMGIDIQSAYGTIYRYMTPRGYANTYYGHTGTIDVTFVQGDQSETIQFLPLGQVR